MCAGRHDPRNLIGLTRCPVKNPNRVAQCITATRGRKVACLACMDQTCCSISRSLRRCAGRSRPVQRLRTRYPQSRTGT